MKIDWSRDALADLIVLRRTIAGDDPTAAARVAARIIEAVDRLADFPGMGRPGRIPDTRELVVPGTPYIVPYSVSGERVAIIAIIHSARKWPA